MSEGHDDRPRAAGGDGVTSGKCIRCRVRWTWTGLPLLRDACCPDCGSKLYQTSHRLRWPVREAEGALDKSEPQEAPASPCAQNEGDQS